MTRACQRIGQLIASHVANFEAVLYCYLLSFALFDVRPAHISQMLYQAFIEFLFFLAREFLLTLFIAEHKRKHLICISILRHNLNVLLAFNLVETLSRLLCELKFSSFLVSFMLIDQHLRLLIVGCSWFVLSSNEPIQVIVATLYVSKVVVTYRQTFVYPLLCHPIAKLPREF